MGAGEGPNCHFSSFFFIPFIRSTWYRRRIPVYTGFLLSFAPSYSTLQHIYSLINRAASTRSQASGELLLLFDS